MIRDETDYLIALKRIDELMGAELGTPEGEELDALTLMVECWEGDDDRTP